jgi:hypothetical protein
MSNDVGNLLIGLGVLITTISAILFKIKYIRNKCSGCLVTDKSFDKDIESAAKVANEVASACWGYRQYPNVEGSTYPSICEGNLRIGV